MAVEDCRAVALRGGLLKIGCIQKAAEGIFFIRPSRIAQLVGHPQLSKVYARNCIGLITVCFQGFFGCWGN